ncbi:hypothetical protein BDZ89DRAFT_263610 [Hymenopellis radicata]|nr:hypothetical protein BDZ89DRAFT_263610 [Hymenopellis radicata]
MQASCSTCGMFSTHIDVPSPQILQSPRIAELLLSNTAPNDAEIEGLRRMVQESSTLMESLQDQIEKAKQTISTLRAIYGATSKRLKDTKKILHPVRSLPRDILAEIFFACTPIAREDDRIHFRYSSEFDTLCARNHPWNLSHVCHAWRETALSLPRLWSTIYLNFKHYQTLPHRQCIFMSTLLFGRSANLDLSITLISDERSIVGHPLTGCLAASTTRWRTFHCRISTVSLEAFSGLAFPLLQELGVGYYGVLGHEEEVTAVDTFRHASNVRTVTFYDSSNAAESTDVLGLFPWNNVVNLSCHVFALEAPFRFILEQATRLEELVVKFRDVACSMDVLILPRLKCLDLTKLGDDMTGIEMKWLHSMRLPSIERLALAFPTGYPLTLPNHHPDYNRIKHLRIVQNHPAAKAMYSNFYTKRQV